MDDRYIIIFNRSRDRMASHSKLYRYFTGNDQCLKSESIQFLEIIQIKMIHH